MGALLSGRRLSVLVTAAVLHGLLALPVQAAPGKRPTPVTGKPLSAPGLVLQQARPAAVATGCKTQRQRVKGVTFRGCHFPGKRADAPGTARAFLDTHGKALDLSVGNRDLELIEVKRGLASAHTRFRQKIAGYPVFQVFVSVHQGREGVVCKHYPEDLVGSVHADGEIWSAALWDTDRSIHTYRHRTVTLGCGAHSEW